ncbi:hypothetical protein HY448_02765 [Candidatus Pacearchaeota archaeon]|nr:hypothetical protein [Candidatus Pacearchaeota archaeon]
MTNGYENQGEDFYGNFALKLRDIEEKQRILKDRVVLIGKNLIESREETNKKILEMKRDLEKIKNDFERIKSFIETVSSDFSKFAKKDDLEILSKQLKMLRFFEG